MKNVQTDDDENILPFTPNVCDNCAINTQNSSSNENKTIIYQTQ